ncbi:hypothetical protein [Streptomyces sp. NPDC054786]
MGGLKGMEEAVVKALAAAGDRVAADKVARHMGARTLVAGVGGGGRGPAGE